MNSGPSRKRNRISLSCILCKKRKVKCDRQHPCSACTKTNLIDQCKYSDTHEKVDEFNDSSVLTFSVKKVMKGRVTKPLTNNVLNNSVKNSLDPVTPEVQSELDILKNKIREIEKNLKPTQENITRNDIPDFNNSSLITPIYTQDKRPSLINLPITSQISPIVSGSTVTPTWMNYSYFSTSMPILGNSPATSLPSLNLPQNSNTTTETSGSADLKSEIYKFNSYRNLIFSGINPYGSDEDTINFYEGYSSLHIRDISRRSNHGPFSWLVITKRDKYLRKLWQYIRSKKHKKKHYCPMTKPTKGVPSEVREADDKFGKIAMDQEEGDVKLYKDKAKEREQMYTTEERTEIKTNMNKQTIALGLTLYEGRIDKELELIKKVEMVLPKKKVVWTLINKFFLILYPIIPFIDEKQFKGEMVRILGPEDYTEEVFKGLRIEKRLDFGHIGILLIMLRMTYLSIFSNKKLLNEQILKNNDPSPKIQETKYLLCNPVNLDVIDLAQLCLNQFEIFRKTNLVLFQCAILMRLYNMLSPEDGNGIDGSETQIFGGLLVQMAYTLGFNREPDNLNETQNDEKTNNICRKIWYYLMKDDLLHACQLGAPFNIELKYFDTKIPIYKEGNENIVDVEMEKAVFKLYHSFVDYYIRMRQILELTLDLRSMIKLKEFTAMVGDFENYVSKIFGNVKDYLTPFDHNIFAYPFKKIAKFKSFIEIRTFLLMLSCHFHLYYEEKNNLQLSFFYLKKIFAVCCTEFIPECFKMLLDNLENFGEGADLVLNPTFILMLQKTNQFCFIILARINEVIHSMKMDEGQRFTVRMVKLCKLSRLVQKTIEYCISTVSRLSNRYYHAWRATKAHSYILGILVGEEFYNQQTELSKNLFSEVGIEELDELITIFEYAEAGMDPRINTNDNDQVYDGADTIQDPVAANLNSPQELNINIVDNAEIDKLWIQIATMKNKKFKGMKIPPIPNSKPLVDDQDIMGKNSTYTPLPGNMSSSVTNPMLLNTGYSTVNMDMDLNGFMLDLQESYPFDFLGNFQVDEYLDSTIAE